ncbi:MAG: VWA domain-containing protein [Acidobacteria bacterium]|nr:VWA domain-containing protein [Acidobacteriota bacterium]
MGGLPLGHDRIRHPGIATALATALATTLGLALSGTASSPAAPPAKDPAPPLAPLIERATVELVLIEAYVQDSRGRPIEGLRVDDFSLKVDGHDRPIASLEFRSVPAPAQAAAPEPGRRAEGIEPGPAPGKRYPRRFILFFEDRTSSYQNLTQARRCAQRFLESALLPDDQVALAAFDRRLRLLQEFTADREALKRTIESSLDDSRRHSDFTAESADRDGEFSRLLHGDGGLPRENVMQAIFLATSHAQEQTPKMRSVLGALRTLVDSLAPYPGYRAIVFMGDGVPENPAVDYFERLAQRAPGADLMNRVASFDLSLEIKQLAHEAAAVGVTLHSVQTTGLATGSAEVRAASRRGNTLATLALQTGGTASTSNDFFQALVEAEAASRAYYLIGYAPEGPPDGQFHTVQLRVKRSGARLRWRRGFTRLLPQEARGRAIEAAYFLPDLYPDLGIEISAVAGPGDGGERIVDLVLHLPPGRPLLVPQPGGPIARLEVGFVVIDDTGRETLRAARQVRIAPGGDRVLQLPGIDFYSRVRLPRGGQTVTAVVADQGGGTVGAARLAIPQAAESTDVVGLSIYSLGEKSLWVEVPAAAAPAPEPAFEAVTDYRTGPALKTTFTLGEPLAYGFRLERRQRATGIRLEIRGGQKVMRSVPVPQEGLGSYGETRPMPETIKMPLPTEGLPAGDYVLAVRREQGGDLASVPFRLTAPADGADSRAGS